MDLGVWVCIRDVAEKETIVEGQRLFEPNIMKSVSLANRSWNLGFVVSLSVSACVSLFLCVVCCCGARGCGWWREGRRRGEEKERD